MEVSSSDWSRPFGISPRGLPNTRIVSGNGSDVKLILRRVSGFRDLGIRPSGCSRLMCQQPIVSGQPGLAGSAHGQVGQPGQASRPSDGPRQPASSRLGQSGELAAGSLSARGHTAPPLGCRSRYRNRAGQRILVRNSAGQSAAPPELDHGRFRSKTISRPDELIQQLPAILEMNSVIPGATLRDLNFIPAIWHFFSYPERSLMAVEPCKASDDPTGCRQGTSANLRVGGLCRKHHGRVRTFGSPYLHHPGPGRPRRGQGPVPVFGPARPKGWPRSTAQRAREALRRLAQKILLRFSV
jgi:hypothetical protein